MRGLRLKWRYLPSSIDNPTWEQVAESLKKSKMKGGNVTIYNMEAEEPGINRLTVEVDEDSGTFFPILLLNPKGMRFLENKHGSAERKEFNGSEVATGAITDDLVTVLRLAKEFYETGDVKEMKEWKDMFFNTQAG